MVCLKSHSLLFICFGEILLLLGIKGVYVDWQQRTQVLSGERLLLKNIFRAGHELVEIEIDSTAMERCIDSRRMFLKLLENGQTIYGVNVGVGALKHRSFAGSAQSAMSRDLILAHTGGIRDALPAETVRMAMFLRLNTLLLGRSGCSVSLIETLKDLLNAGITPVVRGYGSVGCGDIMLNGQIGYALMGGGLGRMGDRVSPMIELMAHANLTPHTMQVKDAISIVSNNAFAMAECVELAQRAFKALDMLTLVAASAAVALHASPTPWKMAARNGKRHVKTVGVWLSALYKSTPWPQEDTVHDPLSIRFLAEIYGAVYDELELWTDAIEETTDFLDENPIVSDDQILTSGGSYLLTLALRTESFRVAIAHAMRNAYNLCAHMIAGRRAGLNVNLIAHDSAMTGLGPFLKVAGALATKACADAAVVSPMALMLADSLEDESNHLPLSLSKMRRQIESMEDMCAVMALMVAQGLDISSTIRPSPVDNLYQAVRSIIPFSQVDQPLSDAAEAICTAFQKRQNDWTKISDAPDLPMRHLF